LKSTVDISTFPAADQVILQALKTYGMIVADNGTSWFLNGSPSDRWDDDILHELTLIHGTDFEAVDLTPVVTSLSASSGSTADRVTCADSGSQIVGRRVFYAGSSFANPSLGGSDDAAIDPTKQALLPGQTATFSNCTGYVNGLNGLMLDISGLPSGGSLSASD